MRKQEGSGCKAVGSGGGFGGIFFCFPTLLRPLNTKSFHFFFLNSTIGWGEIKECVMINDSLDSHLGHAVD